MSNTNKLFTILDEFKTLLTNEVNLLNTTNQQLNQTIEQLKKEVTELKKSNQDKDEELANLTKSSLYAVLNKQMAEQKSQINILEQQLNHYKSSTNTFSKNEALINKLNNDILERDKYIEILESKQNDEVSIKNKKEVTNKKEEVIATNKKEEVIATNKKEDVNKNNKEEVKTKTTKKEPIKAEIVIKEEEEEEEVEYETVTFKKKTYYLVGKKVYVINKDKSLGDYFGKYKNGEVIKKTDD